LFTFSHEYVGGKLLVFRIISEKIDSKEPIFQNKNTIIKQTYNGGNNEIF